MGKPSARSAASSARSEAPSEGGASRATKRGGGPKRGDDGSQPPEMPAGKRAKSLAAAGALVCQRCGETSEATGRVCRMSEPASPLDLCLLVFP